jgi:hypothetical protein
MVGLTQGAANGYCGWLHPGLPSDAQPGLYEEEAASCRFTIPRPQCLYRSFSTGAGFLLAASASC